MAEPTIHLNSEVTDFLDQQKHPFRKEIEQLRIIILGADHHLTENIKWNGPNYCVGTADRITMRIQPPAQQVQLIFHRGAKKREQTQDKLITNKSKMLKWKENDRAVITFKNSAEIENSKAELTDIIPEWIQAAE
ncbi:MAG: DUF1801 domain-containing protein [Kaistella sp.]|nr:DUF1801 domain-containing protein [Kaistella sp.]